MNKIPHISRMGERGILVEFEPEISPEVLEKVLFYKNRIKNSKPKSKLEVINTYNSILISYAFSIENFYSEVSWLKELLSDANITKNKNSKIFYIPVCYTEELGPDLHLIAEKNNLSVIEIIELHTAPNYLLYFIGFLPGFLYLGGLDEKLQISRKETPRKSVEKGAVGIGEKQTGIYPKSSPGGWQIIGKTPVNLFNKNEKFPTPFSAGDRIKFYSISKGEFYQIEEQIKAGNFQLKSENYEG